MPYPNSFGVSRRVLVARRGVVSRPATGPVQTRCGAVSRPATGPVRGPPN